ncbi:hypothetical protein EXIGLDRAFT_691041 [Exidia glandulosa HHB12029]|uniref:Uncharacterized protein n=1 Tax=Exidia glandulosa HHB12029 TaxID=1314781 RepID=A0A165P9G0_EXIGL|nr:hypothetical protein EXIGLDRAFT_691041 [Exidia glandulosa HHB12029]
MRWERKCEQSYYRAQTGGERTRWGGCGGTGVGWEGKMAHFGVGGGVLCEDGGVVCITDELERALVADARGAASTVNGPDLQHTRRVRETYTALVQRTQFVTLRQPLPAIKPKLLNLRERSALDNTGHRSLGHFNILRRRIPDRPRRHAP